MPKKCILILLDGLGDRSHGQLAFKTPLQAAYTPFMNKIAAIGANGLYHAGVLGQALPSENAHFAMFGYEAVEFPGRGALEALGAGIDIGSDDVAVLAHFASLKEEHDRLILVKNKPQASPDEEKRLIEATDEHSQEGINIRFIPTHGLRGILVLRGKVAPFITDTDPMADGCNVIDLQPWSDFKTDAAVQNTARVMKAYLQKIYHTLKKHPLNHARLQKGFEPINGMVTQRAGQLKTVTPFKKRFGLRGLSIASGLVYQGLSAFIGLDFEKVNDTQDPGKDIAKRLSMACHALDTYDFIHVHTKTPDEAAHTKDPLKKKGVIESLDRGIGTAIGPLMDNPDVLIILTADHSTPSSGPLIHSGEPVPLTFCGQGVRRDFVRQFDEINAAQGALGTVRGKELMYLVLNHLNRAKLRGLMDTPEDQPFWPGNYEPFMLK
jgi:2,3-bisphosphoglycerate-independent phosphoglycerate mutase